MLAGALYSFFNTQKLLETAELSQATVIEMVAHHSDDGTTYAPVYQFRTRTGDLIETESSSSSNPPSYQVNERVIVYYNPSNPQENKLDGFFSLWGMSVILGIMGSVFFSVGLVPFLFSKIRNRKQALLKANGEAIQAEIKEVVVNESFSVNNKHPYNIKALWQDPKDGSSHSFKSSNIWFDPQPLIKQEKVTVYINRENPNKYFMDTSFLEKAS